MEIEKLVSAKAQTEALVALPEFKDLPDELQMEVRHFHHIVSTLLDDLGHKVRQLNLQYNSVRHQLYGTSVMAALSLVVPSEPASSEDGTAK